jgi:hypothetical protein
MSFFPETSNIERIKKLENVVRILQRQIRELTQQVRAKSNAPPRKEHKEDDSENCTIS